MSVYTEIEKRLMQEFKPSLLEIIDDSYRHQGHIEAGPAQETHFSIKIVSEKFHALSLLARHRLVNSTLKDLLPSPIHALSIQASSPLE